MIDQLKAAFPAVEWRREENGSWVGRNRRTWVYVRPYRGGYQAMAEMEHRGEGWSMTPEAAVRAALTDLGYKTQAWAERVVDALGKWGQP